MVTKNKYPSTKVVHCVSGPVYACESHGNQLINLGNIMGSHTIATRIEDETYHECINCKNESRNK